MKRVLLVDDVQSIRSSQLAALGPCGLEVEQAETGAAGLQMILNAPWDLIFLDIEMPVMDGPTMLRLIRARGIKTPVVLVSAACTTAVLAQAIKLGATHYIAKPFEPHEIVAAAVKLLALDASLLNVPPARVQLLHTTPALAADLTRLLPANILLDTSQSVAQAVAQCKKQPPSVVLLEAEGLPQLFNVASELRQVAPVAGIFALSPIGQAETPWSPVGPLDGVLFGALNETLVYGFLYLNFLRPLAFAAGTTLRVAAFQGDRVHLPAYFASVARHLIARGSALGANQTLTVELAQAPPELELLARLTLAVTEGLQPLGSTVWFKAPPSVHEALRSRVELVDVVFVR